MSLVPLEGDAGFISVVDVDVEVNSKYPLRFKNSGTLRAYYDLLLRALFIKVMVRWLGTGISDMPIKVLIGPQSA